jgi:hypothetical protein
MDPSPLSSIVLRSHINAPCMFNEDYEQPQTKRPRTDRNDNGIWDWDRTGAVVSSLEHTSRGFRDYEQSVGALVTDTQGATYGEPVRLPTHFSLPQPHVWTRNGPSYIVSLPRHERNDACTGTRSFLPSLQTSNIGLNPLRLTDQVDLSSPPALPETSDQVLLGISQPVQVSRSLGLTGSSSLVCFGMVSFNQTMKAELSIADGSL